MGEHGNGGDRDDEESPVPPADDSPPEADESPPDADESPDAATGDDGTGAGDEFDGDGDAQEDADQSTDGESASDDTAAPPAGEQAEADSEDGQRHGPEVNPFDGFEGVQSAEEWVEEHGPEGDSSEMSEEELEEMESSIDHNWDGVADEDSEAAPDDGTADAAGDDGPETASDSQGDDAGDTEHSDAFDALDASADEETADDEAVEASDDEVDEPTASTSTVSTSDPGKNAPAGMGQPTAAGGATTTGGGAFPDFDGEMAPDDQEQPLTDHIEEMTYRFLVVALVMGLVAAVALIWSDDMINFLWYSFLGPDDGTCPGTACPLQWRPHVYHPLSLVLARLKMAALVGFVAGLPVAVYQTYRFMRPGLYPHERRYYLAAVPTSLVLAVTGVAFAYYVVLPSLFIYFSAYSTAAAELAFALSDTFNLMVMMLGFFAVIFQIPLLVMLAIMMGVVTRRWLEQRRIYFWTGFGGVAFFFSPDPTGMAPLLVAVTMITLFEGTLLLLRWTERSVALVSAETMANNRPYAWALAAFVGYVLSTAPVPEGYFGALPPAFVDTLTEWGYLGLTPAIIAGGIVAAFELLGYVARRIGAGQGARQGLQVRLAFIRARPLVWLLAIVVGYLGSPDPVLLDVFRQVEFGLPVAVGTVFALIALWEGVRILLGYLRPQ